MKKLILKYNAFMLRLDICVHILFHSKRESILQYLDNRLDLKGAHFYKSDEYLLHTLRKKDGEFKWEKENV